MICINNVEELIEIDNFKSGYSKHKMMDWGRMEAQYRTPEAPLQCFIVVVCHMCYVMCDIRCVIICASQAAQRALDEGHISASKQSDGRMLYFTKAQLCCV